MEKGSRDSIFLIRDRPFGFSGGVASFFQQRKLEYLDKVKVFFFVTIKSILTIAI